MFYSTMYNLTQALASGVLRGQDLNAVMSNAQPILENVANYMGVGVEKIREMAADGQLSADVIKNAMLAAADETNAKFEQMPMTFGQVATSIKNQALMQFQPILNKLNEIANSPAFQTLVDNVISAVVVVSGVIMWIFEAIAAIGQFASDNWGWLAPIIYTVVAAMTAYVAILAIYNTIQAISNGLKAMATLQARAKAAAELQASGATLTAAQSQTIFNAALLACPLTWILIAIIAIIGAIYLVIGIINKCAGTSVSATGIIFGVFTTLGAFLWNLFLGLLELVLGVINAMINPFIQIANFIGNVFTNPISSIIYMFQGMADGILAILQKIASALDFVFGSNMADTVAGWRSGLKDMADAAVAEYAPNENYQSVMDNLDLSVEGLGLKRWDYGDAWNTGYTAGEAVDEAIANFDPASLFQTNIPDASDYGSGAYDYSDIASGVDSIDANTKGQLDYSEEELKLWRDIAERDQINRFTTAEVTVEFGDVNNNVSSDMDLDGIADYIGERVEETLYEVAEGVHK